MATPKYDFKSIEEKGHRKWRQANLFATLPQPRKKYYMLEMFAYPSGDIHIGHFRNYGIGDAVTRFRLMQGYDVLHAFGWDSFGLPAENAAIKHGVHPREWTLRNITTGRETLQRMGLSYDWEREVVTSEPDYYKWTQWLFLLLYERGLAYRASSLVNWCPNDGILANELVQDGRCWRCQSEVGKKEIENCWFFRYSDFAERLLEDLDRLDGWPETIKLLQRNWIGRSEGCEIDFDFGGEKLTVFTTRPDTTWGVTFMVVAPEHPIAAEVAQTKPEVAAYIQQALRKKEWERIAEGEKDGVFTGLTVKNPLNGEAVQLWVADYVVATYGTGVVMGVPGHDTRDFAFAKKYGIPIRVVIQPPGDGLEAETMEDAYVGEGTMVNSGALDSTPTPDGIPSVIEYLAQKGLGRPKVNYRLKDWLVSRQRYWGCPIPIIHCAECGPQGVPEAELPVRLPLEQTHFIPGGRSPLADNPEFMKATCPRCGGPAERDPDTMDTFMCSSWYLFRYVDARNEAAAWDQEKAKTWLPVDLYIGGSEHACMHLLYFRFITKVLHDAGWLPTDEPAQRLFNHGMVYDAQGLLMSKSAGNVVSPNQIMSQWGVDVCRLAMFFFAPSEDEIRWKETGLVGAQRFLQRVWDRVHDARDVEDTKAVQRKLHQVIRKVTASFEGDLHFNTSMAAIMEFMNVSKALSRGSATTLVQLLAPLAPFMAEELWEMLGHPGSVFRTSWPTYDEELAREEEVEVVVQLNGKVRGRFTAAADTSEEDLRAQALQDPAVRKALSGKEPRKVIVARGRLVNVVV
jgi:leucyl-tRNA synthetase